MHKALGLTFSTAFPHHHHPKKLLSKRKEEVPLVLWSNEMLTVRMKKSGCSDILPNISLYFLKKDAISPIGMRMFALYSTWQYHSTFWPACHCSDPLYSTVKQLRVKISILNTNYYKVPQLLSISQLSYVKLKYIFSFTFLTFIL